MCSVHVRQRDRRALELDRRHTDTYRKRREREREREYLNPEISDVVARLATFRRAFIHKNLVLGGWESARVGQPKKVADEVRVQVTRVACMSVLSACE